MTFLVMRQENSGPLFGPPEAVTSYTWVLLAQDENGVASRIGSLSDQHVALRAVQLLNRHGMVDAPMFEEMGP